MSFLRIYKYSTLCDYTHSQPSSISSLIYRSVSIPLAQSHSPVTATLFLGCPHSFFHAESLQHLHTHITLGF
jgi:hypothetical protein